MWRLFGKREIIFDRKYIIICDNIGTQSVQKVFRIDAVEGMTLDRTYKVDFLTKIKSFFTKDSGGCICLNYHDKAQRIGYGLSIQDAEEILLTLKRKELLKE